MPPPSHGISPYKMVGTPGAGPPTSVGGTGYTGGPAQSQQYLQPNPYMSRPPMGPNPYGPPNPGSGYGPPPPPAPQQQQQQPGIPPNSTNSPMPAASPGSRPLPPHMGPPTPYPGYPAGPYHSSFELLVELKERKKERKNKVNGNQTDRLVALEIIIII